MQFQTNQTLRWYSSSLTDKGTVTNSVALIYLLNRRSTNQCFRWNFRSPSDLPLTTNNFVAVAVDYYNLTDNVPNLISLMRKTKNQHKAGFIDRDSIRAKR